MATVKATYQKHQEEIKSKIKALELALKRHSKQFSENETNWGYVGDLGRVKEVISELDNFSKSNK